MNLKGKSSYYFNKYSTNFSDDGDNETPFNEQIPILLLGIGFSSSTS